MTGVVLASGLLGFGATRAGAADPPAGPQVTVRVAAVGRERVPGQTYALEALCSTTDGKAVVASPAASPASTAPTTTTSVGSASTVLPFTLAASATKVITIADFPLLTMSDACTVRAIAADGAETSYRTSQTARADGSVPDAAAGVLEAGGYHSAPARANGQVITVTQAFNGDVQVMARVTGASTGSGASGLSAATAPTLLAVEVRCDSGFHQSARMTDGQTQLFTGIKVGAVCRVAELQSAGARYADNSGEPNDGIVTVVASPAACWDLRASGPECRVTVTVTVAAAPNPADDLTTTTSATTTTSSPTTTVAPATTSAPAVTPAPATPVEATPTFTG